MITADTITDEQIRALHAEAHRAGDFALECLCSDARRAGVGKIARDRKVARTHCAEILNERTKRAGGGGS